MFGSVVLFVGPSTAIVSNTAGVPQAAFLGTCSNLKVTELDEPDRSPEALYITFSNLPGNGAIKPFVSWLYDVCSNSACSGM